MKSTSNLFFVAGISSAILALLYIFGLNFIMPQWVKVFVLGITFPIISFLLPILSYLIWAPSSSPVKYRAVLCIVLLILFDFIQLYYLNGMNLYSYLFVYGRGYSLNRGMRTLNSLICELPLIVFLSLFLIKIIKLSRKGSFVWWSSIILLLSPVFMMFCTSFFHIVDYGWIRHLLMSPFLVANPCWCVFCISLGLFLRPKICK